MTPPFPEGGVTEFVKGCLSEVHGDPATCAIALALAHEMAVDHCQGYPDAIVATQAWFAEVWAELSRQTGLDFEVYEVIPDA